MLSSAGWMVSSVLDDTSGSRISMMLSTLSAPADHAEQRDHAIAAGNRASTA